MRPVRTLFSLAVLIVAIFAARPSKAYCVDYNDFGAEDCTGTGGCESSWEEILCGFGCVSGTCDPRGNSTECCGHKETYAQITPEGGGDCSGNECGDARIRVHRTTLHASAEHRRELLQGYTPGLILLSDELAYKEPQVIYSFHRCNHSYEIAIEDGKVLSRNGM